MKNILFKHFLIGFCFLITWSSGQNSVKDDQGIYIMCEKMPELIGGMDGLQKKIRYPLQAKTLGVQGVVYVQSIINEKDEVGYEPTRNFIWDLNGRYEWEMDGLTRMLDRLPLIQAEKISSFWEL